MSKKTYVMFVLDKSGSMGGWSEEAKRLYNSTLETIKERSRIEGLETKIGLITFPGGASIPSWVPNSDDPSVVHPLAPSASASPLTNYIANGNTCLRDAVGLATEHLIAQTDKEDLVYHEVAYLVIVVTDGQENQSRRYSEADIQKKIKDLQGTTRWTFAFNVPPGHAPATARVFGVPQENVREWEQTTRGFRETEEKTSGGVASYLAARSTGATQVTDFYTTDLSGVKKSDLSKLQDLSRVSKVIAVPKESSIKEFVETATKKPYVIGGAYYQLTKKERIQPGKRVLVKEKTGKRIFGGDEARSLIGLPTDGITHAVVTPGNHANFDVFVQSKTVNRKLVRGTHLVLDLTKQKNDAPTWDHTLGGVK